MRRDQSKPRTRKKIIANGKEASSLLTCLRNANGGVDRRKREHRRCATTPLCCHRPVPQETHPRPSKIVVPWAPVLSLSPTVPPRCTRVPFSVETMHRRLCPSERKLLAAWAGYTMSTRIVRFIPRLRPGETVCLPPLVLASAQPAP